MRAVLEFETMVTFIGYISYSYRCTGDATGTSIDGVVARQFAADTGANLSLHDLSVRNLSANYDHFIDRKCHSVIVDCV